MTSRAVRTVASLRRARLLAGAGIATIALATVVAFAGPAFGHEASGISADCDAIMIGWSGFPSAGVPVHIEAGVGSVGTVSKDLTVNDRTAPTKLDISEYARMLSPIRHPSIEIDVTWDYDGPHDTYRIIPLFCGTSVTTTSEGTSQTPRWRNDRATAASIDTAAPQSPAPTSNVEAAGESASSTPSSIASNRADPSTSTSTVAVSAAEATQPGAVAATSGSSLPFTGGPGIPLALIGLSLLTMGAAVAYRARDRRSRAS